MAEQIKQIHHHINFGESKLNCVDSNLKKREKERIVYEKER